MANMIGSGLSWLDEQRHEHLTEDVTYVTKAGGIYPIKATPGQTEFESVDGETAMVQRVEYRDWLIRLEDLPTDPVVGDEVRIVVGAELHHYTVRHPSSEQPYSIDRGSNRYRIHTLKTKVA